MRKEEDKETTKEKTQFPTPFIWPLMKTRQNLYYISAIN